MMQTAVALKYARALFDTGVEQGSIEQLGSDMTALASLLNQDPAFLNFLVSPEMLTEQKHEFIGKVFEPRLSPMVTNFIRLLVDKSRINFLPEVCEEFSRLVEEHHGVLRAKVYTAVPFPAEMEAKLKTELDRITGKNVALDKKVDPSVLGGVVVHLGNKIIDRSLRQGIKEMRETLLKAEVN